MDSVERDIRGQLGELERRVTFFENVLLRGLLVLSAGSLLLGLVTPLIFDEDEGQYLVPVAFLSLSQPPDTAGGVTGENTLLGIGFLGTFVALLVTVAFLIAAWNRHLGRRWGATAGIASVLLSIGIAVIALLVFSSGMSEPAGTGIFLLMCGAVTALIVVFGLRPLWAPDRP